MFRKIQYQPIRTGHLVNQAAECARFRHPFPDAARRILQACLTLVGEIERTVATKMQVVAALKAFGVRIAQRLCHSARIRVQMHDPVLEVR